MNYMDTRMMIIFGIQVFYYIDSLIVKKCQIEEQMSKCVWILDEVELISYKLMYDDSYVA